jgi:uncharacterized Zn finger protein
MSEQFFSDAERQDVVSDLRARIKNVEGEKIESAQKRRSSTAPRRKKSWWSTAIVDFVRQEVPAHLVTKGRQLFRRSSVHDLYVGPGVARARVEEKGEESHVATIERSVFDSTTLHVFVDRLLGRSDLLAAFADETVPSEVEEICEELEETLLFGQRSHFHAHCTCPSDDPLCAHNVALLFALAEKGGVDSFVPLVLVDVTQEKMRDEFARRRMGDEHVEEETSQSASALIDAVSFYRTSEPTVANNDASVEGGDTERICVIDVPYGDSNTSLSQLLEPLYEEVVRFARKRRDGDRQVTI